MASRNVVLVHGGFVDGSGWEGVYSELKKDAYSVSVVQNPTLSPRATRTRPSASSTRKANRSSSLVTPTAER